VLKYWVLGLDGRRIVVHRAPHASGYADRDELSTSDRLRASSLSLPELDIGELLNAADG
jgi:hypothetical protein